MRRAVTWAALRPVPCSVSTVRRNVPQCVPLLRARRWRSHDVKPTTTTTTTSIAPDTPTATLKAPSRKVSSVAEAPLPSAATPEPTPEVMHTDTAEAEAAGTPMRKMTKAIAILTGSQFLSNAGFALMIPVLPQFASEIGLGATGVGAILSAPALARVVMNIPLGKAADVYGRKPLLLCGSLLGSAGAILTAHAFSLATVLPARILTGAGSAALMTGASAYMADVTAKVPHQRAKVMGVQHTIVAASYVAGPAIGGLLAEAYGVRTAFLVVGCALAASSCAYSFLEESNPKTEKPANVKVPGAWKILQDSKETQGVAVMTGALFLGYTALHCVLPLHAAATLGASTGQVGMLFSAGSLAGMIGAPTGGYIADRFGRGVAVVPAAALCATAAVALANATTYPLFFASIVAWGFGSSVMNPGLTALAADAAPAHLRGESLAIPRQAGDIAFLLGPISLGILADLFSCGFALMVTCFFYLAAALFFVWRTRGSSLTGL